ncbi:MAG: DUF1801 domain-containing protein [Lentilitoribacter sp.]
MSKTNFGSFEDLIELTPDQLRPIVIGLKEIILSVHPETCEVVRLGDRAATYGVGPKKMSEGYCYILPHSKWVNLGFYKGADLADPSNMLEGTGAKLRHIKIKSLDECDDPEIGKLIKSALDERKTTLGIS